MKVLLDTNVITIDKDLVQDSLLLKWSDFEDSLQFLAAKRADLVAIITRNQKDFKSSDVPVFTPS